MSYEEPVAKTTGHALASIFSQDQLSDLLGCGKKFLSRWENGREYPSHLVNTLLRLLEQETLTQKISTASGNLE